MSDIPSESLHQAIQNALNTGDFDKTRELSTALGQAIIREAQAAPPQVRAGIVEKSLSRLREHISMARVLRAHVVTQLQSNTASSLYQQSDRRGHSWRFDA